LNGNTVVSVQTTTYSSNHHAVTVTLGGDTGAVSSTTFYDSFNNPVLSQSYPSTVQTNFTISYYDAAGRLTQQQDELQRSTFFTYDGLGRVARKQLPDGAAVLSGYNSEGGLTSMTMPGGLVWSAAYNQANQRISEQLWNGTSFTRQFTNILYGPGLFAGLPQQTVDVGRHVTNTFTYDSFGRVSANAAAGGLDHPEQALVTTFQYDRQGLITNYTQTSGVNPTTSVIRYYDGYKQLTNEQVAILGISTNTVTERWTAAGRRAVLKTGLAEFDYTYRADGTLTNLTAFTNAYCYNYGSNGLLISRSNSWRTQNITQRDGRGRVTQENDKSFLGTQVFGEALSWLPDSTLSSYQATRTGTGFWNSTNVYQYNTRGQLTNELLGLSNGTNAAYTYGFDANKLGIRTSAQLSGGLTNGWQATSLTNLNEVFTEKWQQSAVTVRANGSAGSASSVATILDGRSVGNAVSGGRW
jgi:YD repeat-containing protein